MIAVFKTGGKQYCVKPGQILRVEKIEGKKGETFTFNEILALSDKSENSIGNPLIKGASIEAKILEQIKDKKIIVFKKRRRKNYRLTQGHRQNLTVLRIESIKQGDKKITADIKSKKIESSNSISNNKDTKKAKETKTKTNTKTAFKKIIKNKKIVKKTIAKKTTKSKK